MLALATGRAEPERNDVQRDRRADPSSAVAEVLEVHEPHAEREQQQRADTDEHGPDACEPEQERNLGRSLASASNLERSAGKDDARDKQKRSQEVKEQR